MRIKSANRIRFGEFELNVRAGELCCGSERVVLQEQPLRILLMLVEGAGEIVTREEIKKRLWPNDTIVEFDHSIHTAIKKLRRAVGDAAENPRYIETIPRRGYRLIVPAEWVEAEDSSADESSAESSSSSAESSSDSSDSVESHFESLPKGKLKVGRLTGKTVSHYRVLEIIGGGGMGLVYRAEDLKLGRAVAVKFLPEDLSNDPKALARFEREARAVSALSHPNICPIYEFDEYEGQPFIVMELLHGKTLREHLADGAFRLTDPSGLEIAIQVASGLEVAHERGIIHRDIKPANIFITEKNVAKILDFGVAKVIALSEPPLGVILSEGRNDESKDPYNNEDAGIGFPRLAPPVPGTGGGSLGITNERGDDAQRRADARHYPKETTLTRTGMKLGTAGYMSPEQIRGEPLDARTDIFSFGLVLYEMATGERAFSGETEAILHDGIEHRAPRPVRGLAPEISPNLAELIPKCLQKRREDRFQSISELRRCLVGVTREYEDSDGRGTKSRSRAWALTAVALVLLGILSASMYRRYARPTSSATDDVTTSSPEARQAFMHALELRGKDQGDPIPYYKRAIELDPEFAMAYLNLGNLYLNANGSSEEGIRYLKRAYELRQQTSRAEQLMIEASYYEWVTGELDKALIRYEEWSRLRPESQRPYVSLSYLYNILGQPENAITPGRTAIRLGSNLAYGNLVASYFKLNRFGDARAVIAEAESRGIQTNFLIEFRYLLADFENDEVAMRRELGRARNDPALNGKAIQWQGDTAFVRGRFREAQRFYSILPNYAASDPDRLAAGLLADYEVGYVHEAQTKAAQAMASPLSHPAKCNLTVFYGRTGNTETATRLLHEIETAYPTDLGIQRLEIPTLKAAIALGKRAPAEAIVLLEPTAPYELTGAACIAGLEPAYLRGLACLQLGKGSQAAIEFQRVVEHRILLENERILNPLSFLYLARAQVMMGDKEAARKSYNDFLTLWKDADPDIPIYKQAKAEYAKLP